jgi:hypothetical protein
MIDGQGFGEKRVRAALVCRTCGGRGVERANLRPRFPVAHDMNSRLEGQEWLVLINQDHQSRMSTRQVQASVRAGKLTPDTLVWRGGMSAWASIGSVAELAPPNSHPTVPRRQAPAGYNPRFAETVISSHRAAQQYGRRPTASSPRLVRALMATGVAVLLTVVATSYALYTAGVFQAGSVGPDADAHPGAASAAD